MANYQLITKIHRTVYKLSGGLIGARMGKIQIALVHTIGRKSGRIISIPLACYTFDSRGILLHASNNGLDKPPQWWLNMQANPVIEVQLGRKKYQVEVQEIQDENEYQELWAQMSAKNPYLEGYKQKTKRKIPIALLAYT